MLILVVTGKAGRVFRYLSVLAQYSGSTTLKQLSKRGDGSCPRILSL